MSSLRTARAKANIATCIPIRSDPNMQRRVEARIAGRVIPSRTASPVAWPAINEVLDNPEMDQMVQDRLLRGVVAEVALGRSIIPGMEVVNTRVTTQATVEVRAVSRVHLLHAIRAHQAPSKVAELVVTPPRFQHLPLRLARTAHRHLMEALPARQLLQFHQNLPSPLRARISILDMNHQARMVASHHREITL